MLIEFYKYLFTFDFKKTKKLLLYKDYDYKIEFQFETKLLTKKIYKLSR